MAKQEPFDTGMDHSGSGNAVAGRPGRSAGLRVGVRRRQPLGFRSGDGPRTGQKNKKALPDAGQGLFSSFYQ